MPRAAASGSTILLAAVEEKNVVKVKTKKRKTLSPCCYCCCRRRLVRAYNPTTKLRQFSNLKSIFFNLPLAKSSWNTLNLCKLFFFRFFEPPLLPPPPPPLHLRSLWRQLVQEVFHHQRLFPLSLISLFR